MSEKLEDICDKCKGKNKIVDGDMYMCGEESALFYALHKDDSKLKKGKYQSKNKYNDIYCVYEENNAPK